MSSATPTDVCAHVCGVGENLRNALVLRHQSRPACVGASALRRIAAAAMRLGSYKFQVLSNFTPVGAIAIFGGAYFNDKWKSYLVPFAALFVSDMIINYLYFSKFVWYTSSLWMYASFFAMVFLGSLIKKANVGNVALDSLGGVLIHW